LIFTSLNAITWDVFIVVYVSQWMEHKANKLIFKVLVYVSDITAKCLKSLKSNNQNAFLL